MKKFLYIFLFVFACCNRTGGDSVTAPEIEDAGKGTRYDKPRNSQKYLGRYEGVLPDKSITSLELSEGFNYVLTTRHNKDLPTEIRGKFSWSGESAIVLDKSEMKFLVGENTLTRTDTTAVAPGNFVLKKVTESHAAKSDAQTLSKDIAGIHWVMTELNGKATRKHGRKDFYLEMADAGTFGAFAGCNSIGGKYSVKDSAVNFTGVSATRMACAEMEPESEFLKMLEKVDNYIRNDKALMLRQNNMIVAKFEAMPEKPKP